MKSVAHSYFWYPGLHKDLEDRAHGCVACQPVKNSPPAPLCPWVWPEHPWQRIHVDFDVDDLSGATDVADLSDATDITDLSGATDVDDWSTVTDIADLSDATDLVDVSGTTDVAD